MRVVDVLVVGGGPAGRAAAAACHDAGLSTGLVDPAPERVWSATYAAWADELPQPIRQAAVRGYADRVRVVSSSEHIWPRAYTVLDNRALLTHLSRDGVTVYTGRVDRAEHGEFGSTVLLRSEFGRPARRLPAAVVIDASGPARVLVGGRPARTAAQQSAIGVLLPASATRPVLGAGEALFMDWRQPPDTRGGSPSFLYGVPLGDDHMLLEETSLARRPGLALAVLRYRLRARLAEAGIAVPENAAEERVRFPVDDPLPHPGRVIPFGAAAGLVHPATGYSIASALDLAPRVASALSSRFAVGPAAAARAAQAVVWPPAALLAQGLRRRALEALLGLPPEQVPEFFELFFTLPERHRRAFLSAQRSGTGTAAAMAALFRSAPWGLRRRLALYGFDPRRRVAQHGLGGR